MSITIEIEPSVEVALKKKADAAGITLEEYAGQILALKVEQLQESLHPRVQRSLELLEPFRGKVGPIPEGVLNPELLYDGR